LRQESDLLKLVDLWFVMSCLEEAIVNAKKILSSNANAAAAIARIDDELDKVRLQHSTSAIAVSSDSHIPIELATKQKVSKMPLHDRNQDTNAILDPAGQVKKAALKNETMKVTDFWKMLEKSSEGSDRLDNKQEAVPSSSTKTSAINNNRVAEDGSQVSFSEMDRKCLSLKNLKSLLVFSSTENMGISAT